MPPLAAGRGAGSGAAAGGAGRPAGRSSRLAGDPAQAGVGDLGDDRRGGVRAPGPAGDRAGRGGVGPGAAGRARLLAQSFDGAAGRAVGLHAGPAAAPAGRGPVRGCADRVPGRCRAGPAGHRPPRRAARRGAAAEAAQAEQAQAAGRAEAARDPLLPGAQDPHLGGVHDADEEPGISGGVVGKVPVHMGEVPDSRQIFGGDCCLRAGAGRERRGRLSRPGPWSAAGRGSAR